MSEMGQTAVQPIASEQKEQIYKAFFNVTDLQQEPSDYVYPDNYIKTTKYTLWNFIPKNLFSQFKRFYNIYFLIAAVLCFVPNASAISPFTQVFPLIVVLLVTLLKDGVEDYYRYQSDQKANNTQVEYIRNGKVIQGPSMDLMAGDIVFVEKGQRFPADLIYLSSSFTDGTCFIETSQLDGESNLKRRLAPNETKDLIKMEQLNKVRGRVECDMPNDRLNSFEGRLILDNEVLKQTVTGKETLKEEPKEIIIPLGMDKILLRGAELRNTEFIFGVCIYAGVDTKIFRNLKNTGLKFSSMEHQLNRLLMSVFVYNALILILSVVGISHWAQQDSANVWYLYQSLTGAQQTAITAMSYYILYTYVIPISLFISLEIVRMTQSFFMHHDPKMTFPGIGDGQDKKMMVRNSNLNEELGRVEYILSDKTGTLTQNQMKVSKWFFANQIFDEQQQEGGIRKKLDSQLIEKEKEEIEFMMRHVALCHSAIPNYNEKAKDFQYESESPDETALLNNMKLNGITVTQRSQHEITIRFMETEEHYELLQVLGFNSDRKRMSVILKMKNDIYLLSKGADSIMFQRTRESEQEKIKQFQYKLNDFSNQGLRTLVFAYKKLQPAEYEAFKKDFGEAASLLKNRDLEIEKVCDRLERDFLLLGCSAIEDKLQDQVPETIDYLLQSGIKIWVLTGDKQETAIQIALMCRLFHRGMQVIFLDSKTKEETGLKLREFIKQSANQKPEQLGLVVSGECLNILLTDDVRPEFLKLAQKCHSVLCCRVTPLQKAQITSLIRHELNKKTLSIGDGANDVSMIQAANIGVGVIGLEGAQAVRACDFAIAQFQGLRRLISVWGRFNDERMKKMIYFSLFKNLAFITVCFWFGLDSAWCGLQIYQEEFMAAFNVVFTSLPPLAIGAFERDLHESMIEKYPAVYGSHRNNGFFQLKWICRYLLFPIWHSVVVYYWLKNAIGEDILSQQGYGTGYWMQAWIASSLVLVIILFKFSLIVKNWNQVMLWSLLLSLFVYILFLFLTQYLGLPTDFQAAVHVSELPTTWLLMPLGIVWALLPDFLFDYVYSQYWPSDVDILREEMYFNRKEKKEKRHEETDLEIQKPALV